ncbi:MAG: DUF3300 domain-containing protein [Amaricoccus sp.]|uniref:DUF3300 domain-containing protein n=1 Tax=Amaricoccus sp. TaxID=1872485 RepID=UPI0039E6089C
MRSLTSAIALAATLGAALPLAPLPGPASAQDVSPALAERLHDAVGDAEPSGGTSFSTAELDHLVAPIALYPDALLAQVLVAATYPDQVSAAGAVIDRAAGMSDDALSDAIASGHWDESILVLLSGFPSVLDRMAAQPDWTRDLGAAVTADHPGIMAAVQTMRTQAAAQGNLTSNAAQVVSRSSSGISIRPADPKVVYVPEYDPDTVYVTRDVTYAGPKPAASGVNPIVAGALGFGAGLVVANLWHDSHHHDSNPGWSDYWQRQNVFDWQGGNFYPQPGPQPAPWAPPPVAHRPGPPPAPPVPAAHRPGPPPAGQPDGQSPGHRPAATPAANPGADTDAAPPRTAAPDHRRPPEPQQPQQGQGVPAPQQQARPRPQAHPDTQAGKPANPNAPGPRAGQGPGAGQRPQQQQQAGQRHPLPAVCKKHPDDPACRP